MRSLSVAARRRRRATRVLKRDIVLDALRRIGGLELAETRPTVELPPWSYRTTVRAGVTNGRAGFRRARSHDSVSVADCLVVHPLLLPLITEARYPGAREVLLRCGSRTGERLAMPVPNRRKIVVPADVRRDFVHERAAGMLWRISADSFFQCRADGVDELARIVGDAADELGVATTALDLYSGVGLFAGVLASRGWSVTAVESSRSAVHDARGESAHARRDGRCRRRHEVVAGRVRPGRRRSLSHRLGPRRCRRRRRQRRPQARSREL